MSPGRWIIGTCVIWMSLADASFGQSSGVGERIAALPINQLLENIERNGDAKRGAVVFHLPQVQCSQCHAVTAEESPLGPHLAKWEKVPSEAEIVESILFPSRKIREGFEAVAVLGADQQVTAGMLVKEDDAGIVLKVAGTEPKEVYFPRDDIEALSVSKTSLMPEGFLNQLASQQQFYDLAKYVLEVAELGPERAAELKPDETLIRLPPLPEYENRIDHARIIRQWDDESLERGQRIYRRVCANCHGTLEQEGSLPTSPRFATSKLKNGSEPFELYQTLTHGFGLMVAQRWMVPQQKYDVIHYIREAYFKEHNPDLYSSIDEGYLARLPAGDELGPEPSNVEPYVIMDYGPNLNQTYEITLNNSGDRVGRDLGRNPASADPWKNPDQYFLPGEAPNYAYKGIAVRLDPGPGGITRGQQWVVYDHDTLNMHAYWTGEDFIDYCSIQFDGQHNVHNRLKGDIQFENSVGPGWAQPVTGVLHDPRPVGRDGRPYGPLPKQWCQYEGLYHHGAKVVLAYRVGNARILEHPATINAGGSPVLVRNFQVGPAEHTLSLRLASDPTIAARVIGPAEAVVGERGQSLTLDIAPHTETLTLAVFLHDAAADVSEVEYKVPDLSEWTQGGPPKWNARVATEIRTAFRNEFQVDELTLPESNPWNARMRATGIDFFPDGNSAAVCTWDGDVWIVSGIAQDSGTLTWQRIASGMFQPLGIKIHHGHIFVTCRDQLVRLHDLNHDGETDFYECFNNDHQVTEHFHEFAMGLQIDDAGNFYYAKSGRHAKRAVVPHHGTLLRVSPDGSRTDVLATGFRAANGVCLNPDGTFFVTDQEGHWNPKNRINWVKPGGFYGNMYSFTDELDSSDAAMEQPLCWITNEFDRSPAELLWVPRDAWGQLGGALLNLSYGYGRIYLVPHEKTSTGMQGGMIALPIPDFPSGLIRGRFLENTNDLFVCGMFSWAGSRQEPGCFYRVRYTGDPVYLPVKLTARGKQVAIHLSDSVAGNLNLEGDDFEVRAWDLKRTANYGSKHFNERSLAVTSAVLSADGRELLLEIPELLPTWGMSIEYDLPLPSGGRLKGLIHNSIHQLNAAGD